MWLCCVMLCYAYIRVPSLPSNYFFFGFHVRENPYTTTNALSFNHCWLSSTHALTQTHTHEHNTNTNVHAHTRPERRTRRGRASKRTAHKQLVSELIHSLFHLISILYGRNNQIKSCTFRHQNHFIFCSLSLTRSIPPSFIHRSFRFGFGFGLVLDFFFNSWLFWFWVQHHQCVNLSA